MKPKLKAVKESKVIQTMTIKWSDDNKIHYETDPPRDYAAMLGLLVTLVRQLGG